MTLIRYLKERVLTVDIFDANSHMHVGTAKIPLFNLLRQGKELHASGQECDVCEPKYGKLIAKMQVIMSNQVIPPDDPNFLTSKNKNHQPNQKKHRYKHVASKPVNLAQVGEGSFQEHLKTIIGTTESQYDNQARLQLRIEKMKKRQMLKSISQNTEPNIAETSQRNTILNQISFIRDQQKEKIFENVVKNQN